MNKEERFPHLTPTKTGHTLYINVKNKVAEKVSQALVDELGEQEGRKSRFVIKCILSGVLEPRAQKRNKHALKFLDRPALESHDSDLSLWIEEDLIILIEELLKEREDIRMALLGCPTNTTTEFTGELSEEYKERYGDE